MNSIQPPDDAMWQRRETQPEPARAPRPRPTGPGAKFLAWTGQMMIYLGMLGVLVGGAIFVVGCTSDPNAEPECDDAVMKPGDTCIITNGGSTERRSYAEAKSLQEGKPNGMRYGTIIFVIGLAGGIGGGVLNSRFGDPAEPL